MKYPKEYLDEIRTRLKVSAVVSKTVSLKKRGKEFIGLSPFKNEKTPSFTVNDEKGFYHCFSTSEHGNIFDFLMKTQNLKFGEAVRTLANLAGMRPYTFSKKDEEREKKKQTYISIYKKYINFYHEKFIKNNTNAKEYLKKRNLNINDVKNFKIGFVDKESNLYNELINKFDKKVVDDSGLFYFDEKNKKFVERFRDRLIFPINNLSGEPIALGGRIISENNYLAKYINSPETEFFKKGSNLYNLDKARKFSNIYEKIYLVEGYMDVIGLNSKGIENSVANLGTSLTERQILVLNQFFNHIVICFDGDESGYKAAVRAAENSIKELKPEKKISFLFLPEKEDPDSFINKNGKEYFLKYSDKNLIEIHEFLFEHFKKETDNSPSSLAIFEKKLRLICKTVKDEYIKKYILEYFLEKISKLTPFSNYNKTKFKNKSQKSLSSTQKHFNETKSLTGVELKEYSFLYLIINDLNLIRENLHLIKEVKLFSKENKLVFNKIIDKLQSEENLSIDSLEVDSQLIDKIFKFASIKNILQNKIHENDKKIELLDEIVRDLKNYELEFRIEELESKFSQDLSESTFNEIRELKKLQKIN
tara:strand:+ start:2429 stop:4198 length:1770 start_codon:yes stop_codon:yes gene_type:complete